MNFNEIYVFLKLHFTSLRILYIRLTSSECHFKHCSFFVACFASSYFYHIGSVGGVACAYIF